RGGDARSDPDRALRAARAAPPRPRPDARSAQVTLRLATAPVTWGVWERTIDRDDLIPRDELLGAAAALGYRAIELGPPGYLGADAASVRAALEPFGLDLVGAFVLLHLADEQAFEADLEELDRTLGILADAGTDPVVLLADAGSPERLLAA